MARFPKHVVIIAHIDPSKPDGVAFHMETPNGEKLESLVFSKNDEKMAKKDEHELHFSLVQESGQTLEFAQSLTDVLWVAWGDKDHEPPCPQSQPANCPDPVFYAEKSTPKKLTVVNTNPDETFFSFTINFTDRTATGAKKLIPFDPIGENKNGGIGRTDPWGFTASTTTTVVLVGAAAVLLGYLLLS
jgi:hypothetical protein